MIDEIVCFRGGSALAILTKIGVSAHLVPAYTTPVTRCVYVHVVQSVRATVRILSLCVPAFVVQDDSLAGRCIQDSIDAELDALWRCVSTTTTNESICMTRAPGDDDALVVDRLFYPGAPPRPLPPGFSRLPAQMFIVYF